MDELEDENRRQRETVNVDPEWVAEILTRSEAYAAGKIEATDWRESLARSRRMFEKEWKRGKR